MIQLGGHKRSRFALASPERNACGDAGRLYRDVNQNIARFDILINNPVAMSESQPFGKLNCKTEHAFKCALRVSFIEPFVPKLLRKASAFHIIHDHEPLAIFRKELPKPDNVFVPQFRKDSGLIAKHLWIRVGQLFYGYHFVQMPVVGHVNSAESALVKLRQDFVLGLQSDRSAALSGGRLFLYSQTNAEPIGLSGTG